MTRRGITGEPGGMVSLRHRADLQTLLYMLAATVLLVVQWRAEQFIPGLYLLTLLLAFAVGIMNHNHCHQPMWQKAWLNRLSDCWFTLFLGHPGFVFELCHEKNHHRHRNRAQDWTRTWRQRDDNCLLGLLRHPFESSVTLRPHIVAHLRHLRRHSRVAWLWVCSQYALLVLAIAIAFALDPGKAVWLVLVPQLTALFFLLAANYLQHAHTDEASDAAHSRTFLGWVNPLFFNIGLHSAHHLRGGAHWSELPGIHARIAHTLDQRMVEPSLGWYCLRVFVLSAVVPRWRSRPRRKPYSARSAPSVVVQRCDDADNTHGLARVWSPASPSTSPSSLPGALSGALPGALPGALQGSPQ